MIGRPRNFDELVDLVINHDGRLIQNERLTTGTLHFVQRMPQNQATKKSAAPASQTPFLIGGNSIPGSSSPGTGNGVNLAVDDIVNHLVITNGLVSEASILSGSVNQTLRHNGTKWVPSDYLKNYGTTVVVGNPTAPYNDVEFQVWTSNTSAGINDTIISATAVGSALPAAIRVRNDYGQQLIYVSGGTDQFVLGSSSGDVGLSVGEPKNLIISSVVTHGDIQTQAIATFNQSGLFIGSSVTSPSARLHVQGAQLTLGLFRSTGANNAAILIDNQAGGNQASLVLRDAGTAKWQIGKQTTNELFIFNNTTGQQPLIIAANDDFQICGASGNCSIGKFSPTEKLDVNGNVIATGYKASDGSAGVTVTDSGVTFKQGLRTAGTLAVASTSIVGGTAGRVFYDNGTTGAWTSTSDLKWDNTNKWLGVGGTPDRPVTVYSANNTLAVGYGSIVIIGNSNKERFEARSYGAAPGPGFHGIGGGGTSSSPTASTSGMDLLILAASGYDNAGTPAIGQNKATLKVKASENWTTAAQGCDFVVELTPSGSTTRAEMARFTGAGSLGVGVASPVSTVDINGSFGVLHTTSSATSLTLGNSGVYVFTGSSGTTWTLPAISAAARRLYHIKNRGSANITLQRAGSDQIYDTSAVTSITITPGQAYVISNDGTYWLVM